MFISRFRTGEDSSEKLATPLIVPCCRDFPSDRRAGVSWRHSARAERQDQRVSRAHQRRRVGNAPAGHLTAMTNVLRGRRLAGSVFYGSAALGGRSAAISPAN